MLRPAAHNRSLMVLAKPAATDAEAYAEVDERLIFQQLDDKARAAEVRTACAIKNEFTVDAASVIVTNGKQRLRLPKGPPAFDRQLDRSAFRAVREVESERSLANIHGTFYEVPRTVPFDKKQPLDFYRLRPAASHDRSITDFCTWRGLLVLAGCNSSVGATANFHKSSNNKIGLWFGGIDDLWRLGKPVGIGGPWHESTVKAGIPSDPYLMTGYDQKRVLLSHNARTSVHFRIEVDVTNDGTWHGYAIVQVAPGETLEHKFPAAFGAHWVRLVADADCRADATFHYE
jgi:hypothetical protein